jgi:hypothetical protein
MSTRYLKPIEVNAERKAISPGVSRLRVACIRRLTSGDDASGGKFVFNVKRLFISVGPPKLCLIPFHVHVMHSIKKLAVCERP